MPRTPLRHRLLYVRPLSTQLVVPTETTIPVELRNTINSLTAFVGQAIYCDTIFPITVGNRIVISAGGWVKGEVTQVARPGHVKGRAQLGLRSSQLLYRTVQLAPCAPRSPVIGRNGEGEFQQTRIKGSRRVFKRR